MSGFRRSRSARVATGSHGLHRRRSARGNVPAGESIGARLAEVRRIHSDNDRSLTYVYAPELDVASHAKGIASDAWTAALEEVDAAVGSFATSLGSQSGNARDG